MGEKQLRLLASEAHRVSVECAGCKSAVVFEAIAQRGPGVLICPNCGVAIGQAHEAVNAYRTFMDISTRSKLPVYLVIDVDD